MFFFPRSINNYSRLASEKGNTNLIKNEMSMCDAGLYSTDAEFTLLPIQLSERWQPIEISNWVNIFWTLLQFGVPKIEITKKKNCYFFNLNLLFIFITNDENIASIEKNECSFATGNKMLYRDVWKYCESVINYWISSISIRSKSVSQHLNIEIIFIDSKSTN